MKKLVLLTTIIFLAITVNSQNWFYTCGDQGKINVIEIDSISYFWITEAYWNCYGGWEETWIEWNIRCHTTGIDTIIETARYDSLKLILSNKDLTVIGAYVKYRRNDWIWHTIAVTICEYGSNDIDCYREPIYPEPEIEFIGEYTIESNCVSVNGNATLIYWHVLNPYFPEVIGLDINDIYCLEPGYCFYLFYCESKESSEIICIE